MSCGQVPGISSAVVGVMPCPAASPVTHGALLSDAYLGVMWRVRVLAALRAELAAHGVTTGGMVATRLQATLDLPGGRTVTCRGGWLSWSVPDPDRKAGSACAVHWAGDLAGATGRLTRPSRPMSAGGPAGVRSLTNDVADYR
jgi:hypothetical protein